MDLQQSAVAVFKDLTAAIVSRKYAPGDGLKRFLKEGVFLRVVIFLSKYTLLAHTQMYECSDSAILFLSCTCLCNNRLPSCICPSSCTVLLLWCFSLK